MQIIPAIDIKNGQCIRLRQGRMDDVTVFETDPLVAAAKWVAQGTSRLHLVDLDGAIKGCTVNAPIITKIAKEYPQLDIQVGGGIRTEETIIDYLAAGVNYLVLGTKAVENPDFIHDLCKKYPYKIILGVDAKDGNVSIDGWEKDSDYTASEFVKLFKDDAIAAIIYTDISRDGMMQGVNIDATVQLAQATSIPVIASGGISSLDDVKKLLAVSHHGISGAITGRAIYEGKLDLQQANQLCQR